MKYYLIAGEASGDLHASRLIESLKKIDNDAQFRCIGGDLMQAAGATLVRHYKELAYMGFIPVLLHLRTILRNMKMCKRDILQWQPDALILIDYPGFNLNIAKYIHRQLSIVHSPLSIHYYISPKIWAWKEHRIKNIKRDIDHLYSILPFEVGFYEGKHHYPIHYVGNPTKEEVETFKKTHPTKEDSQGLPIIALLCGSRKQEIKDNLPAMLQVTDQLATRYRIIIAGAPAIDPSYYEPFTKGHHVELLPAGNTYTLLSRAHAALVTSGTATLETALFGVPQVVCYKTPLPRFTGWLRRRLLKVKYISLVNLIADSEVVPELVADTFSVDNIRHELQAILSGPARQQMLEGYQTVALNLGDKCAPHEAATLIYQSTLTPHTGTVPL